MHIGFPNTYPPDGYLVDSTIQVLNNQVQPWGAKVAQWWEHSPPTDVAPVQILVSTPYVGWVCCWLSPLLWEVFVRVLGFLLSSKTNISKLQFDQE